jgi:hypothetical protein
LFDQTPILHRWREDWRGACAETTTAPRTQGFEPRSAAPSFAPIPLAAGSAVHFADALAEDFAFAPFEPVSLDRFVDEVRLEAAAVRVPLLAPFDAPDFLEAVDLEADFLAPPAFDADFFAPPALDAPAFDADLEPPRAAVLFVAPLFDAALAALLPADLLADLPALLLAAFVAPPLLDFDVVAFAITTSLGEPLARP